MKRAIRNHLTDFIAILVLVILAVVVSGYVLSHERLQLPFIGTSQYKLNAEFSTGQALTPGQGQTVRVSGVQVGDIGQVKLQDGMALVQLDIDTKYRHLIHEDWTALVRPRTGLDDMFIELQPPPGGSHAPVAPANYTIPISNTNPVVNPDEILASLDADTRAYLDLLVNGAGAGLKAPGGGELAEILKRFLPTHRSLAELNSVVAERGAALRSLIHSLNVLNAALAVKQGQIVQLVDSSSKVFQAWASANGNVSQAVADLPGTLQQTTTTLQKVQKFADIVAPATRNLIPAVSAIPAANAATAALAKPITPVLRNQIRPFVTAAKPLIYNLRPAAQNLAAATPNLSKVFTVLNHLFNQLGYYPSGGQHGYLWWLAWADHNARTVFSTQDANGDFRQLFIQASCASLSQVVNNVPGSESVLNLTGILTSNTICPTQAAANRAAYARYTQEHPNLVTQSGAPAASTLESPDSAKQLFYPKLPTN
ncbi:MAG TPA: MlaD family protein [Solirubrobacteraceae bacterium]|nr:MlaD family protein [Solirubrobacteraceae bacterium]